VSETRLRSGGRTLTVALAADGDGFAASIDGVPCRIERVQPTALTTIAGTTVEDLDLVVDGRATRVVVARTRDRIHVAIGGDTFAFERVDDAQQAGAAGAGSGSVVAPMPGKVVKVLVAAGDTVAAGQPLVVVEAMKMETTLAAEIDGTVSRVHAEPGAMVDAGAVLIEIDAAAA